MPGGGAPHHAARRTVLVALAANASIAVAKLVAGLVSGSAAMLAEAAHSVADTMNQVLLLYSLAMGEREADAEHPFGYGKERFFWSFLAAVGIFVAGAGFSLYEGLHRIFGPAVETGSYGLAYAVLAFAFVAEGASLVRAWRHTRDEAAERRQSHGRYVRASRDPTTKTVRRLADWLSPSATDGAFPGSGHGESRVRGLARVDQRWWPRVLVAPGAPRRTRRPGPGSPRAVVSGRAERGGAGVSRVRSRARARGATRRGRRGRE